EIAFPEQRLFADALSAEVRRGIVGGNIRIRFRIPECVIDAVEDTGQVRGAASQQAVQSPSILVGLNFARVCFADCVDGVAVDDARLHEIDAADKLERARMEQSGWETDVGESVFRKQALVSEV